MNDLPTGWSVATISDVTEPITSIDPKKSPKKTFRYVDIGSIDNQSQVISEPKTIVGADAPSRARRVIRSGDTLFSTVRTYLKNIALVPEDLDGELTSTGIAVLRPNALVDPKYLFKWSCCDEFVSALSQAQDGTMYPAVTDGDVEKAAIRVPPLVEQRRIVAKIDSLSAKSRNARDQLDRLPRLIEKYKQAILAAAFRGELVTDFAGPKTTRANWRTIAAGGIIENIVAGKNLRCEERLPRKDEKGVLKVSAVSWGDFDATAAKTLPTTFEPPEHTRVCPGDLLISRANTLELVGAVVIVRQAPHNLYLSDKVLRLELAEENKPWLMWFLRSPQGREAIESSATGNQLSMRNLSQEALRNIDVPWPDGGVRRQIVVRIERAFGWIDRLAAAASNARKLFGALDQAMLAKAFRGELVPQDENDEPASVLLERLKSERRAGEADPHARSQRSRTPNDHPKNHWMGAKGSSGFQRNKGSAEVTSSARTSKTEQTASKGMTREELMKRLSANPRCEIVTPSSRGYVIGGAKTRSANKKGKERDTPS